MHGEITNGLGDDAGGSDRVAERVAVHQRVVGESHLGQWQPIDQDAVRPAGELAAPEQCRDRAVHRVDAMGATSLLIENVESPADIGYDAQRNRVLVPLFTPNRVIIKEVPATPAAAPR